jgi:BRCT domain type II-containing protein
MVKHKSVKEMMAERQPLLRKPVEPINIYSAQPETPETKPEQERAVPQPAKPKAQKVTAAAPAEAEPVRPYSTYLHKGQVKGIKLRAVERDVTDMEIVQEAIDEYFKKHPL